MWNFRPKNKLVNIEKKKKKKKKKQTHRHREQAGDNHWGGGREG